MASPITVTAVPITYAPVDIYLARNTTNFYIEDADQGAGMRVEDGPVGWDNVQQDGGATITGIKRTSATTGEVYLELSSVPEIESAQPVAAVSANTQTINTDPTVVGKLINLSCTVSTIAGDRMSMTITDGGVVTTVKCESKPISNAISVGNTISLTGVVSKTGTSTVVILCKHIDRTNPPMDPLAVNLECWYKFNETSGTTAADSSEGNGRNGTLVNGPTWVAGKINNAVNFDGTNDYVTVPSIGPAYAQFSLAAWVNVTAFPAGSGWAASAIMSTDGWTDGSVHFLLLGPNSGDNAGKLQLSIGGFGDVWSNTAWTSLLGTWVHVAVTYDRTVGARLYVNGAFENSIGTSAGPVVGLTAPKIASWGGSDRFLNGKVDDFRLYSRVLSDAEINTIYLMLNNYTITASAGTGGTITPSGAVLVSQGSNQTFTIAANTGYAVSQVTVDSVNQGAITSYTFTNVQANHTISATFVTVPTYTITASAGANGTISPSGAVVVNQGSNKTFTITPNAGYVVDTVTVDSVGQGAITSYTFTNVQANHTISATFKVNPNPYVAYYMFDETSGTTASDSSGSGYNGTINAGCSWVAGHINNALNFNGTSGSMTVPNLGASFSGFSIVGWINVTALPAGTGWQAASLASSDNWGSGAVAMLLLGPNSGTHAGQLQLSVNGAPGNDLVWSATNFGSYLGTWVHVAAVYSTTGAKVYFNGVPDGTATFSTSQTADFSTIKVGTWNGNSRYFSGKMDDLRFYNIALSDAQIATIYGGSGTFTITASSGANGSIDPSGAVVVNQGANQTFTMTANSGYRVSSVTSGQRERRSRDKLHVHQRPGQPHDIGRRISTPILLPTTSSTRPSGTSAYDWSGNGKTARSMGVAVGLPAKLTMP